MNEDSLILSVRSFLKEVGVSAQRELESALHDVVETETLDGTKR